jgi:hypothetical protein
MKMLILTLFAAMAAPAISAQQVPKPVDRPYPGIIELLVDASNIGQRIFEVHERIPVKPGKLTLLYPQWRLGAHAPAGFLLSQFAGLVLSGNHHRLEWQREPLRLTAHSCSKPTNCLALTTTITTIFSWHSATNLASRAWSINNPVKTA